MFLTLIGLTGNVLHIFVIAVERFLHVCFPLKSIIWITVSKTKKVSGILTLEFVLISVYKVA